MNVHINVLEPYQVSSISYSSKIIKNEFEYTNRPSLENRHKMTFWKCCVFVLVVNCFEILVGSESTTLGFGEEFVDHGITDYLTTTENYSSLSDETTENIGNLSLVLKMATECETPNHDVGFCVGIKQCSKLYKQLNNRNATPFLRNSMCGPDNEDVRNPKVCCGRYDNFRAAGQNFVGDDKIFPEQCGNQKMFMGSRIFGGRKASLGEYPWMARLVHKSKYGYRSFGCSGFLIHQKYVLTAAHCTHGEFTKVRGPVFSVQLGEHNTATNIDCTANGEHCADAPQISRAAKVIVHPKYDPDSRAHYNDIALVHLNKGARFTEYVKPICLQTDPKQKPSKYYLSGWGKTETEYTSKIKMKVDIPSYDQAECREIYATLDIKLTDTQLCAGGEEGRDSCTGDSGGPLMMTPNGTVWYAAGIVSYGLGCGTEGWPGVYTNIASFVPWIKQQIKRNSLVGVKNSSAKKHRRKHKVSTTV